jgi:predicted nucleotidyltransferase
MNTLSAYKNEINALCANHKVKSLYAFGSVLTPNFNTNSDIDLIVDFKEIDVKDYADNYFDFKFSLQDIFNRPVDLLEEQAIKNPYFKQVVNQTKELVYGYDSVSDEIIWGIVINHIPILQTEVKDLLGE